MTAALQQMIAAAFAQGAAWADTMAGRHSGEITARQARKVYGKWFTDAVAQRRLSPARVEDGRSGRHLFSISDILALKVEEAARAELKQSKHNETDY